MSKLSERQRERTGISHRPVAEPAAPRPARSPAAADAPHAPVIFFDGAPTLSVRDGVIGFTLTASHHLPLAGGQTSTEAVVAAHLRCSVPAARQFHDALGKALLLAAKPEGERH